jgi:hypothetical protein
MNEEDKQNRQLLYAAVYQKYISAGASLKESETATEQLIYKHINNLFGFRGLAYQMGEISFPFFCKYFLQDTFIPKENNAARELAPVHLEVWDELDRMFLKDEFDKEEFVLPRGCAKTTIVDFALSVWLHCYKKSTYTLVCGRTEQDSTEFLAQTRQAFEENKYILDAFGKLVNTSKFTVNKLELELSNKTKIQAISSTSSMRGKKYDGNRPSVIIADDYQGRIDIITQEARDKKYNTWMEDSGYAGDKAVYRKKIKIKQATKFIVCGTILHRDCFMSRLLTNKDYKHVLKRAVEFDVDEYFHEGLWEEFRLIYFNDKLQDSVSAAKEFYYQYESEMQYKTIWEDKFDCLDLAIDYYTNPQAFKQEMMNDASKIGDKWFKSNLSKPKEDIENHIFVKTMLCVDPASTSTKSSDSFAFLVGSLADNDFKYVRKAELLKMDARTEFDKYIEHIIKLLKDYPDITCIYIEKNTFNGSDANRLEQFIEADPLLRGRDLTIVNEPTRANKDDKIASCVADVNNGRIIFNAEDTDFIQQVMDFAGQDFSQHDDAPDIVSEFANRINDIVVIGRITFMDKKLLFRR